MNELGSAGAVAAEPARPRWKGIADADDEFRTMFVASYPSVARTVWLLVGDREVAQEITQEAFIRLFRALPSYRGGSVAGWLFAIAIARANQRCCCGAASRRIRRTDGISDGSSPRPNA